MMDEAAAPADRDRAGRNGADDLGGAVREIFEAELNIPVPSTDADLIATGLLDSLALVELLVRIEERFGLEIPVEELELDHFLSIDAIAAFLAERRAG